MRRGEYRQLSLTVVLLERLHDSLPGGEGNGGSAGFRSVGTSVALERIESGRLAGSRSSLVAAVAVLLLGLAIAAADGDCAEKSKRYRDQGQVEGRTVGNKENDMSTMHGLKGLETNAPWHDGDVRRDALQALTSVNKQSAAFRPGIEQP